MALLRDCDLVVAASGVLYRSRMTGQATAVDSTVNHHDESLVMVLHQRHGPWSQSPIFSAGSTVISYSTPSGARMRSGGSRSLVTGTSSRGRSTRIGTLALLRSRGARGSVGGAR